MQRVIEMFSRNRSEWERSWSLGLYRKALCGWREGVREISGYSWAGSVGDQQPWGLFWRRKAGPHSLSLSHPQQEQGSGDRPSPRHQALSWDWAELGCGLTGRAELWGTGAQGCYRAALARTDASGGEMSPIRSWAGTSDLLMPSRLWQDGPIENAVVRYFHWKF